MPLNNYSPGLGAAAEYQISALPWCTSSIATSGLTLHITFPHVTKYISFTNHNTGSLIRLGFSQNGVEKSNYIKIDGGNQSHVLDVRVKEVFIRSDGVDSPQFSLFAGLTLISNRHMPTLTGSALSDNTNWAGVG